LLITVTDESAIAAAASIGFVNPILAKHGPQNARYSTPTEEAVEYSGRDRDKHHVVGESLSLSSSCIYTLL
jgi:hypothetical protein